MKIFSKENNEFLSHVAEDFVSINDIRGIVSGKYKESDPTKVEFNLMIQFIMFLFNKYGNLLTYSSGPEDPIDKNEHELVKYLK